MRQAEQTMPFLTDNQYHEKQFNTLRNPERRDLYGTFQLAFLMARGLQPDSVLLDFGCADLRLGEKAIPFLARGHYFGADLNRRNLDREAAHLRALGIDLARTMLIPTIDTRLDPVPDGSVDLAFSNSVFSHLTLNTILLCLGSVAPKLKPGAAYYSSVFLVPEGTDPTEPCIWEDHGTSFRTYPARNPYHYTLEAIAAVAGLMGMTCETCPDYGHPIQTMVRFAPATERTTPADGPLHWLGNRIMNRA